LCLSEAKEHAQATILNKYNISYFRCNSCEFIQAEEPYWLDEVYANVINLSDIGYVSRNIHLAKITGAILTMFYNADGQCVDFGGGYGLLVRLMRDAGFNFYRYEPKCVNLFASSFEASPALMGCCEVVTAFEVFEHLVDPVEGIEEMLAYSKHLLFTTELVPDIIPLPDNWWYYGVEHGQHLSFFSLKSLQSIASKFSLNLYTDGRSIHLLTTKRLFEPLFLLLTRYRIATLLQTILRRESLLPSDYKQVTGNELEPGKK
jgi:hypothetical protein